MTHLRILCLAIGGTALLHAQYAKLDGPLTDLIDSVNFALPPFITNSISISPLQTTIGSDAQVDAQGRILTDLYLDGSVPMNQFVASLNGFGAAVTGINPYYRFGAVSAYVPVAAISNIAATSGLSVMTLSRKPVHNVGNTTSQGARTVRADVANTNGFLGSGITVGVLSDSYNTSPTSFTTIRAANDIASNDLPTPKLVVDNPAPATGTNGNTDEGRAMMQIVHDVAPNAALCFETAFAGEASFASNIRDLRTNALCNADVIVDDVFYFDEPFFSDGQVAQAVNDVVTSSSLAGKKVAYFSSAGNQGSAGGGGSIDVPAATFSTSPTGIGNINLSSVATCTSSPSTGSTKANVGGGWLDFGGGNFVQSLGYTASGSTLIMQWDDPFYSSGGVSTDLNWYLFSSSGTCIFAFAADNFILNAGIEVVGLSGGSNTTYRIMVARTSAGTQTASRVRLTNLGGWSGGGFSTRPNPTTFGHSAAANGISVAAYRYNVPPYTANPPTPAFESFSSPGPVTIAFDAAGNRLAVAESRKKPDIAAPDGGNTTFFYPGSNPDGDGFPNFFGTSAAAPHAAGVAALMLGKGGPNSLTAQQIKSVMQTTTPARVVPFSATGAVKGFSIYDGFGLIDAVAAIAKLP